MSPSASPAALRAEGCGARHAQPICGQTMSVKVASSRATLGSSRRVGQGLALAPKRDQPVLTQQAQDEPALLVGVES
ncbi:hypothetical protein Y590_04850 [Methylobacterium sp. AMS5]|nr:hypothetical protein Y590_04850 [Methylobacterium sp. AMS5]